MDAIDTLAKNNIQISHVIIDDNWQDIEYKQNQWDSGWKDFEAEPKTFPRGLRRLISDIRSKHKSIQHVAVWHTIVGYWYASDKPFKTELLKPPRLWESH